MDILSQPGVYLITRKSDGKSVYVGETGVSFAARWCAHYERYPIEDYEYRPLVVVADLPERAHLEEECIRIFGTLYNKDDNPDGGNFLLGKPFHSPTNWEEVELARKRSISAAMTGRTFSAKHRANISASNTGNPRLSAALKGKKQPNISAAKKGKKYPNLSAALRGNPRLSAAMKGKPHRGGKWDETHTCDICGEYEGTAHQMTNHKRIYHPKREKGNGRL